MRLATMIAPREVELRDARYVCPCQEQLLESVLYHWLRRREDEEWLAPASQQLDELLIFGLIEYDEHFGFRLTQFGETELARLWGPGFRPPWVGGWAACSEHGIYDAGPGDPEECPYCVLERDLESVQGGAEPARPWWSRLTPRKGARHPL
jgi:hypothetical protein